MYGKLVNTYSTSHTLVMEHHFSHYVATVPLTDQQAITVPQGISYRVDTKIWRLR